MTTQVLGRSVTGDICRGRNRCAQRSGEEFLELLDAILAAPSVHSVRWQQYTPFFNDGDTCEFTVYDPRVRLVGDDAVDKDEDDEDWEDDPYLDTYDMRVYGDNRTHTIKPEFDGIYQALNRLSDSMDAFEEFLKESFGDHAEVDATREGFFVGSYHHD